jgi:hypothetical protein
VGDVFSAVHSARNCGENTFISAGASVPGVSWKRVRTPSTVNSCPVWVTSIVGAISEISPVDVVCPSPAPTWPSGP